MSLVSIGAQDWPTLRVVMADGTAGAATLRQPDVVAALRYLQARGVKVNTWQHRPGRGMAGLHAFLLARVRAACCLFVAPDLILESGLIGRLHAMLVEQGCGFVGSAAHCLQDGVSLCHVRSCRCHRMHPTRACRVAWVDGCVLFDTAKLRAAGGFDVSSTQPLEHPDAHASVQAGMEVEAIATAEAQRRVMRAYGGCGLMPSGAYRIEAPGRQGEQQGEPAADAYAAVDANAAHAAVDAAKAHAALDALDTAKAHAALDSGGQ